MPSDVLELLAESQDGVYAVDMHQRIVLWNRGAERILGHRAEEVLGKRCYQVIGGLSEEEAWACGTNCAVILWARQGHVAPSQTVLTRTKDDQPRWIGVTHVLIPAEKRDLSTLVHVFHDVNDEVEAKRLIQSLRGTLAKTSTVSDSAALSAPDRSDSVDALTSRELDVLRLLARGLGTAAIAEALIVTHTTVRNHIQRILAKLGVHTRLEAVTAASQRGLL